MMHRGFRIVSICWALLPAWAMAFDPPAPADAEFFEAKVRPLLIARCQECHVGEKAKSGLRLDSREALLAGGDSGPAAVVSKPAESLLIDVISYRSAIQMPPKAKLPDAEITILTEWVRRGLPWPNSKPSAPIPSSDKPDAPRFTDEQLAHWAFQPVRRAEPPSVNGLAWVRSPLDRFILAELEAKSLSPAREVDRRTLLRRVSFDLIGLPPTPEEVSDFLTDSAPDALERVVDRLLASPRYGERWARHWLDVARYADSNGLDENLAYANAYRYRDYVVKAFREDKPYDQFLVEQIAGDLMTADAAIQTEAPLTLTLSPQSRGEGTRGGANRVGTDGVSTLSLNPPPSTLNPFDALTATGFLTLGAKMLAEDDPVKMQMDIIDEQVDTLSRAVMGLTMGCARCHDHKFDPLTAEDYYGLAGVFKSTQTMDNFSVVARWHERPLATPDEIKLRDEAAQRVASHKQMVEKLKTDATEVVLNEARQHAGMYLLAATREKQKADLVKHAKPRGADPNVTDIAGAVLIEAEDFARGNVIKDRETYGKGIGVLLNKGETPNFTEYDIDLARDATYQFELRYAAAGSRPVKVFVDGQLVKADAAKAVTGSWTLESQTWFVECLIELKAGRHMLRLEQPTFFPHIDKLLLVPVSQQDSAAKDTNTEDPLTLTLSPQSRGEGTEPEAKTKPEAKNLTPLPSLVEQWAKVLDATQDDSKSILAAWHQFVKTKRLTVDEASPHNGVARLLGDAQPASLSELAERYERLFNDADRAWRELKATLSGNSATALSDPVLEAARMLIVDPKGPFAVPTDIESTFSTEVVARLKTGREELKQLEQAVPKFLEVMAVADMKPENLKIHLRGSHLTLGREVPHQLPRVLTGNVTQALTGGSGRLELAQWLASPSHPLTARVMVNRVWQWHFGQGLVRSVDNFGRLGERPSHPALLDWLADEFSHSDGTPWSLKSLHRQLITSSTYRMSTAHDANAALVDPENKLLWRFHRQRLEVEPMRDALLFVSGQLDETPGGTLLPTANRAYVTSTANVNPAVYNSNRRSIYLPVVRSALFQVFTAFDFADPSTLNGQRDQTTVAPQALFMMNSEFVLTQSRSLTERLLAQNSLSTSERIGELYELAYSRPPTDAEFSRGSAYLERLHATLSSSGVAANEVESKAWTSLCRAVLAANEFVYVE